ncbi:MAG: hypothetical protein K2J39_00145 [Ruminococcus sp.]|nr:hypothetical protein [Ruminococcus sp.]
MKKDLVSAFGGEYICREKKKDNRYNLCKNHDVQEKQIIRDITKSTMETH